MTLSRNVQTGVDLGWEKQGDGNYGVFVVSQPNRVFESLLLCRDETTTISLQKEDTLFHYNIYVKYNKNYTGY